MDVSIFAKPLSAVEPADLQKLVDESAVENIRLEFKELPPRKDECLKKLTSFANTYGGTLVVGAAEDGTGRIVALPGVDEQHNYDQTIVQWCAEGASPPLNVEVSKAIPAPSGGDKFCYVIRVQESDITPHFVNGRKGVWIRSSDHSTRLEPCLANEDELRQLFNRREAVVARREGLWERAKARFRGHVNPRIGSPQPNLGAGSFMELCVLPRFPSRPLCTPERLRHVLSSTQLSWRGTTYPSVSGGPVSQHESLLVLGPIARGRSIFELTLWGSNFYGVQLDLEHAEAAYKGIHLYQFLGTLLLFCSHSLRSLQALGYDGPVDMMLALSGVQQVPWLAQDIGGFGLSARQGSPLDDAVAFTVQTTTGELSSDLDQAALGLVRPALFAANLANLVGCDESRRRLVEQAYQFNNWR